MINIKEVFKDIKIKDLVRESWLISWPMVLIMFYEFLIGISDVYIAGKFGKEVQAAYGLAFQLYFIFIIIGIAIGIGSVSVISRLFTSEKNNEFGTAVFSSFLISGTAGIVFGILGVSCSGIVINNLHIPGEIKNYSIPLLKIYSIGFLFDYILLNTNGVLRACKKIKRSLYTMSFVCILNIVLNFLLAFHTQLKVKGIAVATVISLFTGSIINILYVRIFIGRVLKISIGIIKNIISISWPSGLLQVSWQLASMVLFIILANLPKNNIEVIAAFTNGLKIESAIFLPAIAFNMANAVVVGNLLGRKDTEGAFHGGMVTAVLGVILVSVLSVITIVNARFILSFLSDDIMVINEGVRYLYISLAFSPVMAWGIILAGGLNGAGDTRGVMLINMLSLWFVRIPLCYFLAVFMGLGAVMVWWSMNASISVYSFFITRRYFRRKWAEIVTA